TLATGAKLEKREEIRLTFVSKVKSPRALSSEDNLAIANLPCVYRIEWLRWFNAKIAGRRVLLLLDSFSAHEKTVQLLLEEQGGLQNTAPKGLNYSYIKSLATALQNIGFINLTNEEVIDVDPANLIKHIVTLFAPKDLAGALLPIPSHQQKKTVYKNYVKPLEGYLSQVSRRVTEDTLSRARQTLIHHYFN
ncbi:hypothetical protein K504DRAFT_463678, partial [Pleomassaria siparia CBS 279.74]